VECNYKINVKELMAILMELRDGRPECKGATHMLLPLMGHTNFENFITHKLINRRLARLATFMLSFDHEDVY